MINKKASITILGCGGAFNHDLGNTAALLNTETNDGRKYNMLIDCGYDVPQKVNIAELDAVAITHTHADHAGGLEELAFRLKYQYPGKKVTLFAESTVMDYLEAMLYPVLSASMLCDNIVDTENLPRPLCHFFDVKRMRYEQPVFVDGSFDITAHEASHCPTLPSSSFTLGFGRKKIYWSGDICIVNKALSDPLEKYEYIFHEVQFGRNPYGKDVHTPYEDILSMIGTISGNVILIHLPTQIPPLDLPENMSLAAKNKVYTLEQDF